MSFNLDALFLESLDVCAESSPASLSRQGSHIKAGELLWAADASNEELDEKESEQARLRSIIANLSQQRDYWKAETEEQAKIIADLDHGVSRGAANSNLPRDIVRRINRLQNETARLRSENDRLKEN
ncbi:hypothetical protein ACJQWK_10400 [Exserohilum turcicum]